MKTEETIAAISTPLGMGGIAVIRVSGRKSKQVCDRVFTSVSGKKLCEAAGYTAHLGKIFDGDECIDEAIALVFSEPKSYTGEDVVEISCHGGTFLAKTVLRLLLREGARLAEPGEFTKRAFLNGKMDLTQAESVMSLISARNNLAVRTAMAAKNGRLFSDVQRIKQEILDLLVHLSALLDYPEEGLEEIEKKEILDKLNKNYKDISRMIKHYDSGIVLREGLKTVIVGKPNVGKSTLMNFLLGTERSIVSDTPGTTRDVVEESLVFADVLLRLADTAGIRETEDPVEQIGVLKACDYFVSSSLVFAVFDPSRPFSVEDQRLADMIMDVPAVIVILNKADLPSLWGREKFSPSIKWILEFSAKNGHGVENLKKAVWSISGSDIFSPDEPLLFTERQREVAVRASESLKNAINAIQDSMTVDVIVFCMEEAMRSLMSLTGDDLTDKVIDQVFSQFCVGK